MKARIKDSDIEHLSWVYQRLANVHSESVNLDYMHKLNAIIINLKLDYAYGESTETPEEKEALDAIEQVEPKHGEWWMCDRGGVNVVFLNDEDEWRGDDKDSYSYCNVKPLYKMVKASEKVEQVEWKVGDIAKTQYGTGELVAKVLHSGHSMWIIQFESTYGAYSEGRLSKPETPEAKKERERDETIHKMVDDFLEQDLNCEYRGKVANVCAALYDAGYRKGE